MSQEQAFFQVAKDMQICQIMSLTLPLFYKKTGISPLIKFSANSEGLIIEVGFSPKEPTPEQFNNLIEEIFASEEFIKNNNYLKLLQENSISDINELKNDLIKKVKLIASKRKNDYLSNI